MKLTHITPGQAGIITKTQPELEALLTQLHVAGFRTDQLEYDADNEFFAATVHYSARQSIRDVRMALSR